METQQFYRPLLCEISWCLLPLRVTPACPVCSALDFVSTSAPFVTSFVSKGFRIVTSPKGNTSVSYTLSIDVRLYGRHFGDLDQGFFEVHVTHIFDLSLCMHPNRK